MPGSRRDVPAEDIAFNVLIVDGRLAVVTKFELVIEPRDVAVDSNGGFLFGQLALGARPSFVILDLDPRENVDALLDTKSILEHRSDRWDGGRWGDGYLFTGSQLVGHPGRAS